MLKRHLRSTSLPHPPRSLAGLGTASLLSLALAGFGCAAGSDGGGDCGRAKCDGLGDQDQLVTGAAKEHRDRIVAEWGQVADACIQSGDAIRGQGAVDIKSTVSGEKVAEQISGVVPPNWVYAHDGDLRPNKAGAEFTMNGQTWDIRASVISAMARGYYGPQLSGATVAIVLDWQPAGDSWLEVGFASGNGFDAEITKRFTGPAACTGGPDDPAQMPCVELKRTGTQPTNGPTLVFLDAPLDAEEMFIKVGDASGSQQTRVKIYDIQIEARGVERACNGAIVAEDRFDSEPVFLADDDAPYGFGPGKLSEQDPGASMADGWYPFHSIDPANMEYLKLESGLVVRKKDGAQIVRIANLRGHGFGIAKPDMGLDLSGGKMQLTYAKEAGLHVWVIADDAAVSSTEQAVNMSSLPHCTDNGNLAPCIAWDIDSGKHTVKDGRLLNETKELPLPDSTTGLRFLITVAPGGNGAEFRVSDVRFFAN